LGKDAESGGSQATRFAAFSYSPFIINISPPEEMTPKKRQQHTPGK